MRKIDSPKLGIKAERARFNTHIAPLLAANAYPGATPAPLKASRHFAYFHSRQALIIVSGIQETGNADLALAYGLTLAKGSPLVIILPDSYELATTQRAGFLKPEARPAIWTHDVPYGGDDPVGLDRHPPPTRAAALARLGEKLGSQSPDDELAKAATALHLGDRGAKVADLVEWATSHPDLDAAHRRDERSWQCMGRKVLSIRTTAGNGLVIRSGIHYSAKDSAPVAQRLAPDDALTSIQVKTIRAAVKQGISDRLDLAGPKHNHDEHWLQAVIRRCPKRVGIEQPALRELPAWRPAGGDNKWARGYIDLVGMDGQGDVRVVETKLAANADPLLIFQGLDYYMWAEVWATALRGRLGAAKKAKVALDYVIGAAEDGEARVSAYTAAQAKALDIPWRFQVMKGWTGDPSSGCFPIKSDLLPEGTLPKSAKWLGDDDPSNELLL